MTVRDAYTLAETAAKLGLSADRFRKTWRGLVRDIALPAPLRGGYTLGPVARAAGRGASYAWDPDAVDAWCARRSAATQGAPVAQPSNDDAPPRRFLTRVAAQRLALGRMMRSA